MKAPIKRKKAPTPEPTSTDMLMRRADPMMRQWYPEHAPKKMRNDYRILVTGSRDWPEKDKSFIERQLALAIERAPASPLNILIITGGADGVDTMTRDLCRDVFGIACAEFSAPWEAFRRKFGNPRSAGPVRNKWMVRWGRPDIVLAFHPYIVKSKGTKNCVEQARKLGIPVRIYTGKETS